MARILIAPDSFKGSISSTNAANAIAQGWLHVRQEDEVTIAPFADGGEGTLAAISTAVADKSLVHAGNAHYIVLKDGTAIVELALSSGITHLERLDPMGAHTYEFGKVLADAASNPGVRKIYAALGGSASTDGGVGALQALGARFLDGKGNEIGRGGGELKRIARIDTSSVIAPPPDGVVALVDVTSPLVGAHGAAAIFGPQKGANEEEVEELDEALRHLLALSGASDSAGSGAAGGTAFGLRAFWGATLRSGAEVVAEAIGFNSLLKNTDLVITGEGKFDSQSLSGKVVGFISEAANAAGVEVAYCVGVSEIDSGSHLCIELITLANDSSDAIAEAEKYLITAGKRLAEQYNANSH